MKLLILLIKYLWQISYNVDIIVILFNTCSGFFFQFEAYIIYCFHA